MGRDYNPDDFITQYPGKYPAVAEDAMKQYFDRMEQINSTEVSGEDVAAGKVGAPKLVDTVTLTEDILKFYAGKYADGYELMTNKEAAQKYGYQDIFGMIGVCACDDSYTFPTPVEARETLLVSQICHEIQQLNPVYPGDTLFMIADHVDIKDLTPEEGSLYRSLHQTTKGTVYNQKGEAVAKVKYSTMESVKSYKEGHLPKPKEQMGFMDMWEDPDWFARPEHLYTDEDYEKLKEIWKNEPNRKEDALAWSEVRVGSSFPDGAWGPIFEGVAPTRPNGMGSGGCRCIKDLILDPEKAKTLVRDEQTGILRSADPAENCPPNPEGLEALWLAPPDEEEPAGEIDVKAIHSGPAPRSALINFMNRDICIGYLMKCVGYGAKIRDIKWSIMGPEGHAALGKPVPAADGFETYTQEVPGMENHVMKVHGLTNDTAIIKTYIKDKYLDLNKPVIEVIAWLETLDGDCWFTSKAEIELAKI